MGNLSRWLGTNEIAESNRRLGDSVIQANRELGNKLASISEADIESRNRVDIALKEYEFMKQQIIDLQLEICRLQDILKKIDVPLDINIIPDSIRTLWMDDYSGFRKKFRVEFEVDYFDFKRKYDGKCRR